MHALASELVRTAGDPSAAFPSRMRRFRSGRRQWLELPSVQLLTHFARVTSMLTQSPMLPPTLLTFAVADASSSFSSESRL